MFRIGWRPKALDACAVAFAVLGLLLAIEVPNFNEFYASLYDNWNTSTDFAIRAFHWPPYIWPLLLLIPTAIVYTLGRLFRGQWLKLFNVLAWIFFFATLAIALNWVGSFMLCHPWGCSRFLF